MERAAHGLERGAQDIDLVDCRSRDAGDRHMGGGKNLVIELLAPLARQHLGIIEAGRHAGGIEHDGGGHHGSGQRAPANLVHPGDRTKPATQDPGFSAEVRQLPDGDPQLQSVGSDALRIPLGPVGLGGPRCLGM